jgi:tRNA pseudouridine38-40 synthase
MRFFVHMSFLGTAYRGWQRQPAVPTVQQAVEEAMSAVMKRPCYATGCGRTDAQVHASQFFFHTDLEPVPDFDCVKRLNKVLPPDLAVYECIPVEPEHHARYDARQRTYEYYLHFRKDPFLHAISTLAEVSHLDIEKMQLALNLCLQYTDYRSFCRTPESYKHTRCHLSEATLHLSRAGDRMRFRFTADRFLAKMIRSLVGRILDVGYGTRSVEEIEQLFVHQQPPGTLDAAPPQGLFLSKITYPYLDLEAPRSLWNEPHEIAWTTP